ncbi:MAG: InlB B-repeat-containing protein [Bacilli bacterium]|nr:InlB B-repeat-containing protein [Bacilli bacterium]
MKNVEKWIMVVLIIISVGAIGTAVYFGVNKTQNNEDNEIPSVNSQNGNDENEDKETGSEVVDEEDLIIDNDSIDGEFESQKDSLTTDNNNNKDESNNNKKPIKDKNNSSENIYVDTVIPTPCKVSFEYKIITFSDGKTFGSADWIVGEPYPEPKSPEKEGYVFKGWYLDGKKYDFSKPVMGDITLVAEWEELFYTVTFDTKGGTKIEPQKVKVDGGIVRKPENPTKEGYVFLWWNEKENPNLGAGHVNFGYGISGDSELEAMWAKEKKLKVKQELVGCTFFKKVELVIGTYI